MAHMIRSALTPVAALVIVAAMLLALAASTASAMSSASYKVVLTRNGYESTVGRTIDIPGFSVDGREITVTGNGKTAKVIILEYASYAALSKDWIAVDGYGPEPREETDAFDGRVLYWNTDSVLVVDFGAPNDASVARAAGNSFLGLPVQAGSPTPAPSGSPTPTPSGLPITGGGNADDGTGLWVVLAAMVAGMMLATGATMVIQGVRVRR